MIDFTWSPTVVTALMLLGAAVAYLLFLAGRRITRPKPTPQKDETYGCGELVNPEETHADSEQFFSPVKRVLKRFYKYIRPAHTGVLNTYLTWVVAGVILVLVVILIIVGVM